MCRCAVSCLAALPASSACEASRAHASCRTQRHVLEGGAARAHMKCKMSSWIQARANICYGPAPEGHQDDQESQRLQGVVGPSTEGNERDGQTMFAHCSGKCKTHACQSALWHCTRACVSTIFPACFSLCRSPYALAAVVDPPSTRHR